jgi:hypothetical protein
MVSLVHRNLDYGNFILIELPVYLKLRLQPVLNFRLRCFDHVTDAMSILRWLRVAERVGYKPAATEYFIPVYLYVLTRVIISLSSSRSNKAPANDWPTVLSNHRSSWQLAAG